MRQVQELAKILHWRVYHPFLSKWSEKGYPDLTLARPPKLVFAELKTEKGKLSSHQEEWIELLKACGQEVYIWRPSMFDEITEVLNRD